MAALASVEYWLSDLRWCYLQQTVHLLFSTQIRTPSFPLNWPSLVSTARFPNILWRLWSHKPLHKHDSNKYQSKVGSKAFVICDHKSDETRSVTLVSIAYLVWLMFRVLSNQHYQHRTNQKLRSWPNAVFQNRGVCGQAVPFFPSPSPSPVIPLFFCSRPDVLDELARKHLLRRLDTTSSHHLNRNLKSGVPPWELHWWSFTLCAVKLQHATNISDSVRNKRWQAKHDS